MASIHLNLPDEIKKRLEARAAETGFETVEKYAQALLSEDAEEELVDEDVESLLMQRLNDPRPGIEFTPEFKQQFLEEVKKRRELRGG